MRIEIEKKRGWMRKERAGNKARKGLDRFSASLTETCGLVILTRGLGPERSRNHLFYSDLEVVQHADSDITLYHETD